MHNSGALQKTMRGTCGVMTGSESLRPDATGTGEVGRELEVEGGAWVNENDPLGDGSVRFTSPSLVCCVWRLSSRT